MNKKVIIGLGVLAVGVAYAVGYNKAKKKGYSENKFGAMIFGVPYVTGEATKNYENKSNVVSGGKTVFDEVCYKNCANNCKLDDANCFKDCRTSCTSSGTVKSTTIKA